MNDIFQKYLIVFFCHLENSLSPDWGREIVIRNTYEEVTPSGRLKTRPADVYYFTPQKKKLVRAIILPSARFRKTKYSVCELCGISLFVMSEAFKSTIFDNHN